MLNKLEAFNRFFTFLITIMFAIFAFTWIYDALTITQGADVSMFYVNHSGYLTQVYPRTLGIIIPIILVTMILVLLRFHLARLVVSVGLLIMEIMTYASLDNDKVWFNPFWRNNVSPDTIDYLLTDFLYLSLFATILYLAFQGYLIFKKRTA